MTPHDLVAAFEELAEAPEGVSRLREMVLQLAVRGKLVPQDPSDEPAKVLLERIAAERASLIKERLLPDSRAHTTPADESATPFVIPPGWSPVRMVDLGGFVGGKTPSKSKATYWTGGIPWVSPKDMKSLDIMSSQDEVSTSALEDGLALIPIGSVLIVVRSGILRHTVPVAVNSVPCTINQDLKALVLCPSVSARYVRLMVRGFESYILENLTKVGTTVESMKFSEFSEQPFIFPPLAEQLRIVARVDELMGLLDRLETARTTREGTRVAVLDSALAALREADTPEAVEVAWNRFAERTDNLVINAADIAPLRQAVLALAVRGRLVPQRSTDAHADLLLSRLRVARRELLEQDISNPESTTTLRKVAALPPPHRSGVLPNGWAWACLLDVAERVVDCHNKTAPYVAEGIPIIRTSNVRAGQIVAAGMRYVSEATYSFWSRRCPPRPGDIIFTREAPMGEAAVVPVGMRVCLGQRTMLIRPMTAFIDTTFLLLSLLEPGVRERATDTAVGSTVKHLRVGDVEKLVLAIPPLNEQKRIVAKVNALMGLLDELEERLRVMTATHTAFTGAAVHHLTI